MAHHLLCMCKHQTGPANDYFKANEQNTTRVEEVAL